MTKTIKKKLKVTYADYIVRLPDNTTTQTTLMTPGHYRNEYKLVQAANQFYDGEGTIIACIVNEPTEELFEVAVEDFLAMSKRPILGGTKLCR